MNSYQSCINLTKQQGIHYNLAAFYFLLPSTFKLVDSSDDISGFSDMDKIIRPQTHKVAKSLCDSRIDRTSANF